jgi:hypothetical protein
VVVDEPGFADYVRHDARAMMSFFGRAANLVRGAWKVQTRPDTDASAREAALDRELAEGVARRPGATARDARGTATAPAGSTRATTTNPSGSTTGSLPAAERKGPERDEQGNIKRTL